jgi:4-aminobutyrate aminotransferase
VEVCRRLGELSPCRGAEQRSLLLNSGAEAVENAVKIARAATGRPAIVAFDRGFHGRTLMTMTLTSKVKPYKKGFGPFAPEVYRAPAPYPYRGVSSEDSIAALEQLFLAHVDPGTVAAVILEPVQGEGGFIPMPADFPAKVRELCDRHGILWIDDEVQAGAGRTGPVWAIEHYDAQPDLLVSGKSLGGGLPLAAVTGGSEVMDAVDPGGLGGTFGGNPVSCAAANVVLDSVAGMRAQSEALGVRMRTALEAIASRVPVIGEVRGLGPMLALEIVRDRASKTPAPEIIAGAIARARENGLLLLACGLHGNVLRLLPPLTITDDELARGLEILEASLA